MADVVLTTERLILRHWQPGDLDLWATHLNTPEVTEHLGGVRTPEQLAEKYEKVTRCWAEHGFSFLVAALREGGSFVGTCGIAPVDNDAAPAELQSAVHIGWQMRADAWGQGYATEAARAIMAFAFEDVGLLWLASQTSHRNRASSRIMEKIGMHRRADLDYVDPRFAAEDNPTIIYGLDAAEWRASQEVAA